MNGDLVGLLEDAPSAPLRFTYDASWTSSDRATPISRSLPLSTESYRGARVEAFFDNLLPDGETIRKRLQARFATASTRPFDLLYAVGRDCVGAVQLTPVDEEADVRRIDAESMSDAKIAALLRSLGTSPLGLHEDDDFRISLAGAHEKTALLRHRGRWARPHGATPTSHILKPAIGLARGGLDLGDSVETEWLSLRVAGALGLPIANATIESFEDQRVLVVERFDRAWSRDRSWLIRLPQEDLCQSFGVPPGLKYEADGGPGIRDVMRLLLEAEKPAQDRALFLRANVVAWLMAGIDAHAKNYSVFLEPGGALRLTPLYDVLSAYPVLARRELPRQKIKLAMGVLGKNKHYRWAEVKRAHWLSTADVCAFPRTEMEAILEELAARINPALSEVAGDLPSGFPASVADPIFEGVRNMAGSLR